MFSWISNAIQELFCKHNWEFVNTINVSTDFRDYTAYRYRCTKCMAHKRKKK